MATAEISPETSDRICAHMNDDHAATIHAMIMSRLSHREEVTCKIQNAKMISVTMKEYTLSFVLCNGDTCEMKKIAVPFDPPLTTSAEVRPRLIEDHHRALIPKFSWLITDPVMRMLFSACILLGLGTALGEEELVTRINEIPWARSFVEFILGSSTRFVNLVIGAWYFSLIAHTLEAIYTAYLCKTTLKMKPATTMKWFVLNVCTGFPIMNKVQELVAIDHAARSLKSKSH
ncbi:hypothetical protein ACHAWU_007942 [Discostella pseudostelligera]|uniref:DUF2470 domain-containing protein n=1 Tax=Discostella pseudostelligera TaxID=259834 RepID=A0ABD3M460_9STRA